MYDYDYYTTSSNLAGIGVWTIIAAVLAVVGGILVYYIFNSDKFNFNNKFLIWLRDFANFKTMIIETILKVTYLILTIFITLASLGLIGTSFIGFILTLVLGNLILRIVYETSLVLLLIWKNTSVIAKNTKK